MTIRKDELTALTELLRRTPMSTGEAIFAQELLNRLSSELPDDQQGDGRNGTDALRAEVVEAGARNE